MIVVCYLFYFILNNMCGETKLRWSFSWKWARCAMCAPCSTATRLSRRLWRAEAEGEEKKERRRAIWTASAPSGTRLLYVDCYVVIGIFPFVFVAAIAFILLLVIFYPI